MEHTYIQEENVNIDIYPVLDENAKAGEGVRISEGDLHGNAQKLLYILTRHGFINISKEDYYGFVNIYKKDRLSAKDIADFNGIIDRIKITPEALLTLLLLMGDGLSDRGMNDYFTLKLLKKLFDNKVPFLNLISNHDAEFIHAYEKIGRFDRSLLQGSQSRSAKNLQRLLSAGLVSRHEVKGLINAYKPSLRVLDFSLNEAKDKITIYSHGVIGLDSINHLAAALNIENVQCNEETPAQQIADIINEINEKFAIYVKNNKVTDLIKLDKLPPHTLSLNNKCPIDVQKFPFAHLIWNRDSSNLIRPKHINFVHGHDRKDETRDNIFNLDNLLGKTLKHHVGEYNALYSVETKLRAELKKEETVKFKESEPMLKTPSLIQPNLIEDYQPLLEANSEKLEEEFLEGWMNVEDTKGDFVGDKTENTLLGYFSPLTNTAKSWFWSPSAAPGKKGDKKEPSIMDTFEIFGKHGKEFTGDLSQSVFFEEKKPERDKIKP